MSQIEKLKEYIYPNGKYSNIRSNSQNVKRNFPEIYESIKDDYHIKLYMLLHDIKEIPKCKNPNCNNPVKLESIGAGFRQYCCNACIGSHQHIDKDFSNKIRQTQLSKNILKNRYYPLDIEYDIENKNYLLINNYCKHDKIRIYSNTFSKLFKEKKCLCYECNKELVQNYIPSDVEIKYFQSVFDEFYKNNRFNFNEKWFITNYPKELAIINYFSIHINTSSMAERVYLFRNNLKEKPKCLNCDNKAHFNHSQLEYTKFCESPSCLKNVSSAEIDVFNYVKSINNSTQHKFYLNGREYDIFIPDIKLIIEYNGLYWHSSSVQKDPKYHYEKWKLAKDNNIHLFTIWEDDWLNKPDLIRSMIKNQLKINENKLFARKCEIREVHYKDAKIFLELNHLQGYAQGKLNYGLFCENELVSIMTFSKNRMILKSSSKNENEYELLRFCSKQNTTVVGAANKLFTHFLREKDPQRVISYANCDISNGDLYKTLGFEELGHTGISYWWIKDNIRYHRSNFMKHKLVAFGADPTKTENEIMLERGYTKVFGSGNLKYEWKKSN